MLAATPAARFIPTASLPGAPEDLLVYILSLLPVIDVLSVRRVSQRIVLERSVGHTAPNKKFPFDRLWQFRNSVVEGCTTSQKLVSSGLKL